MCTDPAEVSDRSQATVLSLHAYQVICALHAPTTCQKCGEDAGGTVLQNAKREGCRLLTGGGRQPGFERGYYVAPTIFTGVRRDSQLWNEEVRCLCKDPYAPSGPSIHFTAENVGFMAWILSPRTVSQWRSWRSQTSTAYSVGCRLSFRSFRRCSNGFSDVCFLKFSWRIPLVPKINCS